MSSYMTKVRKRGREREHLNPMWWLEEGFWERAESGIGKESFMRYEEWKVKRSSYVKCSKYNAGNFEFCCHWKHADSYTGMRGERLRFRKIALIPEKGWKSGCCRSLGEKWQSLMLRERQLGWVRDWIQLFTSVVCSCIFGWGFWQGSKSV